MRTLTIAMLLVASACTDAQPCSACPQIQGTYALTWTAGSSSCPGSGPQPTVLTMTQVGSSLNSSIGGSTVQGTFFDTYDFTLSGGTSDERYSLRGTAITNQVVGPRPDGGSDGGTVASTSVRVLGTLHTSFGDGGCADDKFTGDRLTP
jgi:hypothetical protein